LILLEQSSICPKTSGFVNQFIEESISDCKKWPGFIKLIDRIESGDVLFVTKLDQLGWNSMDFQVSVVDQLSGTGVRLDCLTLGSN
jgi:putative DNA-invertase from lambdoid prophage Rac